MRQTLTIIGGILLAIGAIWICQGLGYIGGSFMTGQSHWAWIGTATALGGAAVIVFARRS